MSNIRFLSSVLVMSVFGITSVAAAPSVRMLGTNTSRIGTNTAAVRSDNTNTSSTQRLGTIRSKTVTSGTPVTVNKVASKISSAPAADTSDEARLSLGKYIHATGVSAGTIKPVAESTSTAGVSSNDFINLSDRVSNLETSIESKQAALTIGDGLIMENNVLSIDADALPVPTQVAEIQERVNNIENNYYTADEIDAMLEEQGPAGSQTYYSITNNENVYNSIDIVDEFDEEGFSFND